MSDFSVNLREMMRRATSAARAVSGLDVRDPDRDDSGISIPTLSWPPDPPSYESITRQGEINFLLDIDLSRISNFILIV